MMKMKMKMKKRLLGVAIAASLGVAVVPFGTQAATLATGEVLTITPGAIVTHTTTTGATFVTVTGSYFGMDANGNGTISNSEKTTLTQGVQGLVIGSTQNMGGYDSHSGAPSTVPGDKANINAPWYFFHNTGKNYTRTAITGGITNGLAMSGWTVSWNGINPIDMGGVAWGAGYTNGIGNFTWDGTIGDAYTLSYHATVPLTSTSGFAGVPYALKLVGSVTAGPAATAVTDWGPAPAPAPVPIPAAAWLFGSGLIGLVGVARRRKGGKGKA